ncbi:MAG TPA: YSC84-related protein [Steroidobacteraceae bacterium]|nr:YSC84-related protein [Steroidobacteraceae bacterium]
MTALRRFLVLAAVLAIALPGAGRAASKEEIDARVREAVEQLYQSSTAAKELAAKSRGMLVFPRIIKGGVGIGGEYGEGALLTGGRTADYYNIVSGSIGFQLGVQQQSVAILFMTDEALKRFRDSDGWKAGVDGSVAIATLGVGGELDTETVRKPIVGFVFSNKGLMYNLTLEGSKISRLKR